MPSVFLTGLAELPKFSDPARERRGLQPERDGRVRCSALSGGVDGLKGLMQICLCGLVIKRMPDVGFSRNDAAKPISGDSLFRGICASCENDLLASMKDMI